MGGRLMVTGKIGGEAMGKALREAQVEPDEVIAETDTDYMVDHAQLALELAEAARATSFRDRQASIAETGLAQVHATLGVVQAIRELTVAIKDGQAGG